MTTLVDLVRQFRHRRALVIGDVMVDSYLEGIASRICTEAPVPVVRKTGEHRAPGGAANVAANIRHMGAEVHLLGITGNDIPGQVLRGTLHEHGISDQWLVTDNHASTHHKLRILANGQYAVRFDEGNTEICSGATHEHLLANLDEAYAACDVVVISDYNYGAASDALIGRLRRLRAERPVPLIIDSKNLLRFRDMHPTLVTPNFLEAQLLVQPGANQGGPIDRDEIEQTGRILLGHLDAEHIAITLGASGVLLMNRDTNSATHVPAHPGRCASDVGAGDSFAAAAALALSVDPDCSRAAQIGVEAAGIAITHHRTSIVMHQELLQRVSVRESDRDTGETHASAALALAAKLDAERQAGRTVVFTNGVFDVLHAGHVRFLRQARELGDILVVGVNSDESVRRLKGPDRPVSGERERQALASVLEPVSFTLLFDEDTPADLIRILRPDVHVKGGDYADASLPEAEAVHEVGGQVVILPLVSAGTSQPLTDPVTTMTPADVPDVSAEIGVEP